MRIVLDTSVLFAAFTFEHGLCANLLLGCLNRFELILSEYILAELRRHLAGKGRLGDSKTSEVIDMLRDAAEIVQPAPVPDVSCRDPSDIPILGTALAGGADVIVTGDKDLLVLKIVGQTNIVSPREFTDRYLSLN